MYDIGKCPNHPNDLSLRQYSDNITNKEKRWSSLCIGGQSSTKRGNVYQAHVCLYVHLNWAMVKKLMNKRLSSTCLSIRSIELGHGEKVDTFIKHMFVYTFISTGPW